MASKLTVSKNAGLRRLLRPKKTILSNTLPDLNQQAHLTKPPSRKEIPKPQFNFEIGFRRLKTQEARDKVAKIAKSQMVERIDQVIEDYADLKREEEFEKKKKNYEIRLVGKTANSNLYEIRKRHEDYNMIIFFHSK